MSEIPTRPWLDEFTAASAVDETGSDERGELLARPAMPRRTVDTVPNPLAILRVHRPLSPRRPWCVAPMEDDDVPIRILDEAHVADAAVFDADDLTTGCANFLDSLVNVRDAKRDPVLVRHERFILILRKPERERDVRRFKLARGVFTDRQAEYFAVPSNGSLKVARGNRDEVNALDSHDPIFPRDAPQQPPLERAPQSQWVYTHPAPNLEPGDVSCSGTDARRGSPSVLRLSPALGR